MSEYGFEILQTPFLIDGLPNWGASSWAPEVLLLAGTLLLALLALTTLRGHSTFGFTNALTGDGAAGLVGAGFVGEGAAARAVAASGSETAQRVLHVSTPGGGE